MKKYLLGILLLFSYVVIIGQTSIAPSGSGTEANPYAISTVGNLLWMSENSSEWGSAKYYVQTDSINLYSLDNFSPIGNAAIPFNGSYDGGDNLILNLTIFKEEESSLGLFGKTDSSAVIENLGILYVDILGKDKLGGLVGSNSGSIINCNSSGIVTSIGGTLAGGLVGLNEGIINGCNSSVNITGFNKVGGLVGENNSGVIQRSYSEGSVKGSENVGGLIGSNSRKDTADIAKVSNSYSHSNVTRKNGSVGEKIGGFIGSNDSEVKNSYSKGEVTYENITPPQPGEKVWPEHLRGFSVGTPLLHMAEDAVYIRMQSWGVNIITVNFSNDEFYNGFYNGIDTTGLPPVPPKMEPYRFSLDLLDKIIAKAKKYKIFINLQGEHAVGHSDLNVATGETEESNEEDERIYIQNMLDLHVYFAEKYKDEPTILSYNFTPEPHTKWILDNWQNKIVPDFIAAVRAVDNNTYLILSAGLWGFPKFEGLQPFEDPANKVIYSMHDYSPHNYTHQGIGLRPSGLVYPGMLRMFDSSELKYWDRAELQNEMQSALDFMKKYNVRMFNGEFGVVRWALGADKWIADKVSIFEEYNIGWTLHNYAGAWDGWNVTFPPDTPGTNNPDGFIDTPRLEMLKKHFRKNTEFND